MMTYLTERFAPGPLFGWACVAFLVLVPVVWMCARAGRARPAMRFSTLDWAEAVGSSWRSKLRPLLPLIRTLAIVALVVALARPQMGGSYVDSREGIAIQMVLDVSGSMKEQDFVIDGRRARRVDAVKAVFEDFVLGRGTLGGRENDLIGMTAFAMFADTRCPLTLDHGSLVDLLRQTDIPGWVDGVMRREDPEAGYTALGDAIALATDDLRRAGEQAVAGVPGAEGARSRVMILLTDGANNPAPMPGVDPPDPLDAARVAATLGIKIYTIGAVGSAPQQRGFFARARAGVDEPTLQQIAAVTGARYFRATDTDSLASIYHEIDQLERRKTGQREFQDDTRAAQIAMLTGLALLMLEVLLSTTLLRRGAMTRQVLHPWWIWLLWVVMVPAVLVAVGVAVIVTVDVGEMPLDHADLWWLIVSVPAASGLYLFGVARRRRALARFASCDVSPLLATGLQPGRLAFRAGLIVVACALVVGGIIGPRWGMYLQKQKVYGVDVVVALDVSRSMLAGDMEPNRLAYAKRVIRQQLTERTVFQRGHRMGLIAFAGSSSLRVPLTTDHLNFRTKLEQLEYGSAPRGGTAIAQAIAAATDLFAKSPEEATKIILVVTDGEDHEGDPVEMAESALSGEGIRVYTVGVGDSGRTYGVEVPAGKGKQPLLHDGQIVFSRLDVEGLRKIAQAGGGRYAPVQDLHRLVDHMADLQRAELTTEQRQRHKPRYQWFIAAALMLLGVETLVKPRPAGDEAQPQRTWSLEVDA